MRVAYEDIHLAPRSELAAELMSCSLEDELQAQPERNNISDVNTSTRLRLRIQNHDADPTTAHANTKDVANPNGGRTTTDYIRVSTIKHYWHQTTRNRTRGRILENMQTSHHNESPTLPRHYTLTETVSSMKFMRPWDRNKSPHASLISHHHGSWKRPYRRSTTPIGQTRTLQFQIERYREPQMSLAHT